MDVRLVDYWSPKIREAVAALVTAAQIRAAIEAVHGLVAKDAESDMRQQIAAQVAGQLGQQADPAQLEQTIRGVIADGYLAGGAAARQQLGANSVTVDGATGQAIAGIDWDTWQPGDPGAAALAADGGLADLLDNAGVGIKGISGSALDGLGNAVADGVLSGLSVDDIAASLGDWVTSDRAERIAHTESARSVTASTLDAYQANGVDSFDLILSDGACEECEEVADGGPYPADDSDDAPPIHPYCRCAASPHVGDTGDGGGTDDGTDLLDLSGDGLLEADGTDQSADLSAEVDYTGMADGDLADLLGTTEDDSAIDAIMAELDRRDAAQAAAQVGEAAETAETADETVDAAEAARDAEFDAAIQAGEDAQTAYARIWGGDVETMRRQDAITTLRGQGYTGRGFDELTQDAFQQHAYESYLDAENETRGTLLNKAGLAANAHGITIDPASLFTGTEARARKYASDELLQYWQDHGRLTADDFKASLLGGAMRSAGTAAFL